MRLRVKVEAEFLDSDDFVRESEDENLEKKGLLEYFSEIGLNRISELTE